MRLLLALLLPALLAGCANQAGTPTQGVPATPPPAATPPQAATATPPSLPTPSPQLSPTSAVTAELGRPFELRVGQSAVAGPVMLTLLGITSDSRCPTRVTCVWEGAAEASVRVAVGGQDQGTHTLTLFGQNREAAESSALLAGYIVRFVGLDPYPAEPQPIPAADYVARFVVERSTRAYTPVGDGTFEGVIVPEQDADAFDSRADGYWTPVETDVRALEAGLPGFLHSAAAERSPELWRRQAAYKRQYAGLIRAGRRLVYASFLCSTHGDDWRRQVVVVLDGGDCYFQLTYDVERGTYGDLVINGEA
ncbi:MAG TPA: hypothetical protein VNL77_15330 [Roseiflexaceae bacterium]|nr:hypothetical protein [Roseiflexaceae bacterium]